MASSIVFSVQVQKLELTLPWCKTHALAFIPSHPSEPLKPERAVFSHGYTSHKGDCLNWATRTSEAGVPTIIFDWPGHYLGNFYDVENFDDFKRDAHRLYFEAYQQLEFLAGSGPGSIIMGGHSLGALMALKAIELPEWKHKKLLAFGIGVGINKNVATHVFDTVFYQKTMNIRRQLVSPALDSDVVFPWIRDEKLIVSPRNKRIHLITGEDDLVVGAGGMEEMRSHLEKLGNTVTAFEPKKLPHHEPSSAAPHLFAFLRQEFGW